MKALFLLFVILALGPFSTRADCVFFTQRPSVYQEYEELLKEGHKQAADSQLHIETLLNLDTRASVSGAWNLGVFSVVSSLFRKPVALKLANAEYLDYRPELRQTARVKHYVAVHKVLGDLAVAPALQAILSPEDVMSLLGQDQFQNALYGKYGSTLEEAMNGTRWLGMVMGKLLDPHPLSRATETPPFFKFWCEPHISRALSEMAEIRRRVMRAGVHLHDQQLVVTPDAHVYLIDVDGYTFDDVSPLKTSFNTEATALLERWQSATGQIYSPNLRKKYFAGLARRHRVCTGPVTAPWPDWRDRSFIDCSKPCAEQLTSGKNSTL